MSELEYCAACDRPFPKSFLHPAFVNVDLELSYLCKSCIDRGYAFTPGGTLVLSRWDAMMPGLDRMPCRLEPVTRKREWVGKPITPNVKPLVCEGIGDMTDGQQSKSDEHFAVVRDVVIRLSDIKYIAGEDRPEDARYTVVLHTMYDDNIVLWFGDYMQSNKVDVESKMHEVLREITKSLYGQIIAQG